MRVALLVQGAIWIPAGLAGAWGQFLLLVRRRAVNGAGRVRRMVAEVIRYPRGRLGLPDFRPVIEFAASDGQRAAFKDQTRAGEYDHGRGFEVAYDPADPWGTAVAVRQDRWFWSSASPATSRADHERQPAIRAQAS